LADRLQLALRHTRFDGASLLDGRVLLAPRLAVAFDFQHGARRQRVYNGHTDTVQTARHLVAAATELAARVQRGHHDLGRGLALVLRMLVNRNAAPIVGDATRAVGEERDFDARAVPGHRLVDRVVDDFPDQMVQTARTGGADVHTGTLAHRVETLEHLNVFGGIVAAALGWQLDDSLTAPSLAPLRPYGLQR
jgi:hypothetical protein